MRHLAATIGALEQLMQETSQTTSLNVLEHGYRVREAYLKLTDDTCPHYSFLKSKIDVHDDLILETYQIYHDCGKPLVADGSGRFPDHAQASAAQWLALYPEDNTVAELMRMDMEFHTRRGDDVVELWKHPLSHMLYLTAWAELYANAEMFGGTSSDSFKIKRKRLIQAGKKMG